MKEKKVKEEEMKSTDNMYQMIPLLWQTLIECLLLFQTVTRTWDGDNEEGKYGVCGSDQDR